MCTREDHDIERFRKILVINLVFAYLYVIILLLIVLCIGYVLCEVCRMGAEQRQASINSRLNNIPLAKEAMKKVSKKEFKDLDEKT